MECLKCCLYGIIIAVLIIIIVKLTQSIRSSIKKESFDEVSESVPTDDVVETIDGETIVMPANELIDNNEEKEMNIEKKEDGLVDKIKGLFKSDEEVEVVPASLSDATEEIKIIPKFVDESSQSVMDGVKMIPEPTMTAWQDIYMNENNDNSFMIDLGGEKEDKDQGSGRFASSSPACCAPQYPVPFKLKVSKHIMDNKGEFVPNPYMGNNSWENAGCTCMKKADAMKLATRGHNA